MPEEVTDSDVLDFVCIPGTERSLTAFIDRYNQINKEAPRWNFPPQEQNILEKMVWPLRQAKANYVLGNYLATLALCGIVAEMASMLLFEISTITINNQPLTDKDQENLFGARFEKLRQSRRVKILRAYNIIDDALVKDFDMVASSRNKYLHNWSVDHENLADVALEAYVATLGIIAQIMGEQTHEGRIYMSPAMVRYLESRGAYKAATESQQQPE